MQAPLIVRSSTHAYLVRSGRGLLDRAGEWIQELPFGKAGTRCIVVTDQTVGALYAQRVVTNLAIAGFNPSLIAVPDGEASKSLEQVALVAEGCARAGLDRHGFVVALGGGVVGDLAGFVASIYYRGVPCVQLPTTIIAQCDSAIGGKTGVNLHAGKNLLGTFTPPALVLADTSTLSTLPDREFNEGMAEVIKHAVIRDAGLLELVFDLQRKDDQQLTAMVRRNLEIKAEIVTQDEHERHGLRALLNFGHTVGHAIEQAVGYGRLLHGEAISLGMVAAGRLSMEKAGLSEAEFDRMVSALRRFDLPVCLDGFLDTETIMCSLARDKKFEGGRIRFVLLPRLGRAFLTEPGQISNADIRRAVESLHREF